MNIVIVEDKITVPELKEVSKEFYNPIIKGVVDIEREIVAFGGEWHIDANMKLIEDGSKQKNIWGFNIDLDKSKGDWLEYNSLINIRPLAGNRQLDIQDQNLKERMKSIINSKII